MQGSLCNGLSCVRNLTLSRSRVKLIGAGQDPKQPDCYYFLGLSGKNNQGLPVLTPASANPIYGDRRANGRLALSRRRGDGTDWRAVS